MKYSITDVLKSLSIPEISENRRYWFVRTDGGDHYLDFVMHNYIAIAWDYIAPSFIAHNSEDIVKKVILKSEQSAPSRDSDDCESEECVESTSSELAKATTIYNKIKRFVCEFSVGDVVLIPSKNSSEIAIGIIDSNVYEDPDYASNYYIKDPNSEMIVCPYSKRRTVKWIKSINKSELDVFLLRALNSQHSVSCLDDSASLINRSLYNIYAIGDTAHAIIRAGHPNGMSLAELKDFICTLDNSLASAANALNQKYDSSDLDVKLTIHSPGLIEICGGALMVSTSFAIVTWALNNYRHGGKSQSNFHIKIPCFEFKSSINTESKGTLDYVAEDKKLDIETIERLSALQKSLDVEFPTIDTSSIKIEEDMNE